MALKRLIARRVRASVIFSDKAKTLLLDLSRLVKSTKMSKYNSISLRSR